MRRLPRSLLCGAPLAPSSISRVFRKDQKSADRNLLLSVFRDELLEQQEKYGDKNENNAGPGLYFRF